MLYFIRGISAYIFSFFPVCFIEKATRFIAKSATNAESYDMRLNGEHRALKHILRDLTDDCVVYDVGANVGDWSAAALKIAPQCRLYAFEMIPQFAEKARLKLGDRVINSGLSDEAFETEAWQYGWGASLTENEHHTKDAERIQIKAVRGDDLDLPTPDFIKIDTEGHELKVFKGLANTIKTHRPIIQFEYGIFSVNERVFLKDLFEFLEDYEFYQIFPTKLVKRHYKPSLENFWTVNYIAIPLKQT